MTKAPAGQERGGERRLRRYPTYKDSGVEWLGAIPAHWEARRLKTIATAQPSNIDKKSAEGEIHVRLCNYVDVYYNEKITGSLEFMTATATADQIQRFQLHAGDVLITKDSESWTDIAVPALVAEDLPDVLCGYHLALIRPSPDCCGAFLARAFSGVGPRDQFHVAANGITRFGLGGDALRSGLFAIPPLEEQRAIVTFLDRETAKIDALVTKKERLIELLQEKRAALISRAVTKGLDPTVPMRDSGVQWLGEIPAHWDAKRLVRLSDDDVPIVYGILLPGPRLEEGVPYIGAGDVANGHLRIDELPRTTPEIASEYPRSRVRPGDIVYAIRGSFGAVQVVPAGFAGVNLSRDAARIAPGRDVVGRWLCWALRSETSREQYRFHALGAAITGVNIRDLKRVILPCPPVAEQNAIADFLDRQTESFDRLIVRVRDGIARTKELRSALISAAVTGKIDVRES